MDTVGFEWDDEKDLANFAKHKVGFVTALQAFLDEQRVILVDTAHSALEVRYYCLGKVGSGILTVRFTMRGSRIRLIGAGHWRKGKAIYEKTNKIHG